MTELETLRRAKQYLDKLSVGVNPLDDTVFAGSDIIHNERIARCLFYVSGILDQVIKNGGIAASCDGTAAEQSGF